MFLRRAPRDRLLLLRTTVQKLADAQRMALRLLDAGAACVHITETQSMYVWKGEKEDGREWFVEARTPLARAQAVRAAMADGHPYELPIIESWEVRANEAYVRWAEGPKR